MASYPKPTTPDTYTDSGKQRNYLKPMSNTLEEISIKKVCIFYSERTENLCRQPVARGQAFYCRRHAPKIQEVEAYTNNRVLKRTQKKIASLSRRHKPFYLKVRGDTYFVNSHGYIPDLNLYVNRLVERL